MTLYNKKMLSRLAISNMKLVLLVVFFSGSVPTAMAQSNLPLECGARIVSDFSFSGSSAGQKLCLFAPATDQSRVVVRPCTATTIGTTGEGSFLWKISRRDGGGLYVTSRGMGPGTAERRLDVDGRNDGGLIRMWGANAFESQNQSWNFFPAGNGVIIIGVQSGKCLNIPLPLPVSFSEVFVQQFTCERRANDIWRIERVVETCQP